MVIRRGIAQGSRRADLRGPRQQWRGRAVGLFTRAAETTEVQASQASLTESLISLFVPRALIRRLVNSVKQYCVQFITVLCYSSWHFGQTTLEDVSVPVTF